MIVAFLSHHAGFLCQVGVTPTPEPPMGNPLLETIRISYDDNMASDSVTPDTAYANAGLPYGPMPKETASGKSIAVV